MFATSNGWKVTKVVPWHNHICDVRVVMYHPVFRGLDSEERMIAQKWSGAGMPLRCVVDMINKERDSTSLVQAHDVTNALTTAQRERRAGMSEVGSLLSLLDTSTTWSGLAHIVDNKFIAVLFYSDALMFRFRQYPEVVIGDCTYKTNRFAMPLLMLHAIDNMGHTFVAACALMIDERESTYKWVLQAFANVSGSSNRIFTFVTDKDIAFSNAISSVMPHVTHMLCYWHVRQNVKKNINHKGQRALILIDFCLRQC